jgi:hypothetical protein
MLLGVPPCTLSEAGRPTQPIEFVQGLIEDEYRIVANRILSKMQWKRRIYCTKDVPLIRVTGKKPGAAQETRMSMEYMKVEYS